MSNIHTKINIINISESWMFSHTGSVKIFDTYKGGKAGEATVDGYCQLHLKSVKL
ncbi:hypothetical protein C8R11_101163 [Nitrosomonas aestuarii]|nr:hypothetical protein C8R11_101163 [Nitrosomonas aestuarii]